jgi:hypothetical protein
MSNIRIARETVLYISANLKELAMYTILVHSRLTHTIS